MSKEPATHNFNVMLTATDRENLQKCAELEQVSLGHIARIAIRAHISMVLHQAPTCATGTPCFVPHMHPRRQAPTEG